MLAALLLNLSAEAAKQKLGIARWWPGRPHRKNFREDEKLAEKVIDALPEPEAKRVEAAIEQAVVAVVEQKSVIDYERIWTDSVLNVSADVRRDIQEVLQDRKIRKKRLQELFEAAVAERIRQEEEEFEAVLMLVMDD